MNRRNFLKYLSSIPLIGIPVKALAKEKGWNGIIEQRANVSFHRSAIDPYEDVAEHIYKEYWNNSAELNAKWLKRKS